MSDSFTCVGCIDHVFPWAFSGMLSQSHCCCAVVLFGHAVGFRYRMIKRIHDGLLLSYVPGARDNTTLTYGNVGKWDCEMKESSGPGICISQVKARHDGEWFLWYEGERLLDKWRMVRNTTFIPFL